MSGTVPAAARPCEAPFSWSDQAVLPLGRMCPGKMVARRCAEYQRRHPGRCGVVLVKITAQKPGAAAGNYIVLPAFERPTSSLGLDQLRSRRSFRNPRSDLIALE
jgi:hypothetical protein